jgi:immunoglobulin-like protein involved in spore germination
MRRALLATVAVASSLALPSSAQSAASHLAVGVRVGDHPAFVRVVVDFTDGRLQFHEVEATDPSPFADGRVTLRIDSPGTRTRALPVRAQGVSVQVVQGTNRIFVRITAASRRFKYMGYFVLSSPQRLVIDLWKAVPPSSAAEIRRAPDRCLTLERSSVVPGRVSAAGGERNLFEHSLVVILRRAEGRVVAERPVTAANGRWSATFPYRVSRRQQGTLEAVAESAKDGSLVCLVQVTVTLRP